MNDVKPPDSAVTAGPKKRTLIHMLFEGTPFAFNHGEFYLEFIVQALPCYIFLVTFTIRYYAIKDLGFPKRRTMGLLLLSKLFLTLALLLVRVLQISAAFYLPQFWLYRNPYALLYAQFVVAQSLSFYLLLH